MTVRCYISRQAAEEGYLTVCMSNFQWCTHDQPHMVTWSCSVQVQRLSDLLVHGQADALSGPYILVMICTYCAYN